MVNENSSRKPNMVPSYSQLRDKAKALEEENKELKSQIKLLEEQYDQLQEHVIDMGQ